MSKGKKKKDENGGHVGGALIAFILIAIWVLSGSSTAEPSADGVSNSLGWVIEVLDWFTLVGDRGALFPLAIGVYCLFNMGKAHPKGSPPTGVSVLFIICVVWFIGAMGGAQ